VAVAGRSNTSRQEREKEVVEEIVRENGEEVSRTKISERSSHIL